MIKISMTGTPIEMKKFMVELNENKHVRIVRKTDMLEHHGNHQYKRVYLDIMCLDKKSDLKAWKDLTNKGKVTRIRMVQKKICLCKKSKDLDHYLSELKLSDLDDIRIAILEKINQLYLDDQLFIKIIELLK